MFLESEPVQITAAHAAVSDPHEDVVVAKILDGNRLTKQQCLAAVDRECADIHGSYLNARSTRGGYRQESSISSERVLPKPHSSKQPIPEMPEPWGPWNDDQFWWLTGGRGQNPDSRLLPAPKSVREVLLCFALLFLNDNHIPDPVGQQKIR
jgi:hypothetical protein